VVDHGSGVEQFKLLADNAPVMIWRSGLDKMCDFFNEPWLRFSGRTMEQELGFGWAEGVHPDDYDRCVAIYVNAFDAREEFSMPYRLRRHDGEYRWLLDNGRPFHDADDAFSGYFGSCIDITEMVEAQERLQASLVCQERLTLEQAQLLREKEGLLREVHHRSRNNLQTVISLLSLQAKGITDGPERTRFRDAVMLVRSIALAQDSAHESSDYSSVDSGPYLERLARQVGELLPAPGARLLVDLEKLGGESILLDVALPVGLAVTELLRAALQSEGIRQVTLTGSYDPDDISLVVAADGSSAYVDDQAGTGSLGLRLVRRLISQADGHLEIASDKGVVLKLPRYPG
jgi:two-component system, sensor histidine kinase PdtaS